jgi:glycosyltransferase involved in cell wall biosynthesis
MESQLVDTPKDRDALSHGPSAIHVLTLTPFYPFAGDDAFGSFVAEPLPWLQKEGIKNTVMAVRPVYRKRARSSSEAFPATLLRYLTVPGGFGLPFSGAFLFARIVARIRRLHEAEPVDLIHAHTALPCGHAASLLSRELGIPYVVTVHGLDAFSTRQVTGSAGKWCAGVSRSVYRAARSVICVSEKVRSRVIEGAGEGVRSTVVYNGVDPQTFYPPENEPAHAVILSVGNLIPIKGHELLLKAFALVRDRFSGLSLSLEIIGEGPQRSHLQKLASDLGLVAEVNFPGHQSRNQVAEAMRRAIIFALPSRYEGLGCVYLEAMSAARPVIACRGQGIEEIIQPGVNGCLIDGDRDDLPGLADTLSVLLRDGQQRQQLGKAARQTIMQGYTQAQQAARLSQLYRECRE